MADSMEVTELDMLKLAAAADAGLEQSLRMSQKLKLKQR